jgi:hypothetical protein
MGKHLSRARIAIVLFCVAAVAASALIFSHNTSEKPVTQAEPKGRATTAIPLTTSLPQEVSEEARPSRQVAEASDLSPAEPNIVKPKNVIAPPTSSVSVAPHVVASQLVPSEPPAPAVPHVLAAAPAPAAPQVLTAPQVPIAPSTGREPIATGPSVERITEPTPSLKIRNFWFWLGSGVNFQYHKQTIPSIEGQATFNDVQGPTAMIGGGFQGDTFGMDMSYKDTPGQMDSSSTVSVTNGNYHWRTLSVDGLYRMGDNWNLRLGFQHHQLPFMVLDPTSANIDIKTNTLTVLTAGFDRQFLLTKDLRTEWMMHYQQPVLFGSSDGTPMEITPRFTFDGSLGGVYSLTERLRLGLFWYGQWHQYSFDYGRGSAKFSGDQTLFYSSVEMRLGFEF